jgi:hypothetical protein
MRVYRVQNEYGYGLYQVSDYATDHLSDLVGRHPMPYNDSKLMEELGNEEYCGKLFAFCSLEQLKFWIHRSEDRAAIHNDGCRVYVIETDEVWVGDTQCVFRADSGTVVDVLSLIYL